MTSLLRERGCDEVLVTHTDRYPDHNSLYMSSPFIAADAEDEIVIGNQCLVVVATHHRAPGGQVDPLIPVPDGLEAFGDLYGQVGALGQATAQRDAAEVQAKVEILHRDVAMAGGNGFGNAQGHLREGCDDWLRRGDELQSGLEHVGL